MAETTRHSSRLQLILRNLPHLIEAEKAGSLHRASGELGIAQSALSRRIAEVEAELGGAIFTRSPSGIAANNAGAAFLQDIEKIVVDLERAIRRFTLAQSDHKMLLRVGFNSAAMMSPAMATALRECRLAHPQCELRLSAHLSEAQYALILAGELDMGIAYVLDGDLPLRQQVLGMDRIVLALPADHPLAKGPLQLHNLDGLPYIAMQKETSGLLAAKLEQKLLAQGVRPKAVMEAGSSEAALKLVAAGLGFAFINATQSAQSLPNVVFREVEGFNLQIPIASFWRQESETPLLMSLVSMLTAAFVADDVMPKGDHLL